MSCNVSNDALSTSKQNPMTRKKSGSILKKQSSFRNKKKKKKKYNQDEQSTPGKTSKQQSVGFIVPDYDPSQEEKEHQQVVDEIYEAYNLEITVVHDGRDIPETEESLGKNVSHRGWRGDFFWVQQLCHGSVAHRTFCQNGSDNKNVGFTVLHV